MLRYDWGCYDYNFQLTEYRTTVIKKHTEFRHKKYWLMSLHADFSSLKLILQNLSMKQLYRQLIFLFFDLMKKMKLDFEISNL